MAGVEGGLLNVEAPLPQDEHTVAERPCRGGAYVAASVLLVLAGCCTVGVGFLDTALHGRQEALPQQARKLQAWAASDGAGPLAAPVTTVEGFQQPPPISNALNAYFTMMTGSPVRKQAQDNTPGNQCAANEELHVGMCYLQCKILTNGSFPLRTSAWTCCQGEKISDCFIQNQDHNVGLCSGYDVAGDGKSCPKAPGQCLSDEEFFGGECYQKCTLMTNGTHPYRTSAFSCCDSTSTFTCFQPSHVTLSSGYTVGGNGNPAQVGGNAAAHQPGSTPLPGAAAPAAAAAAPVAPGTRRLLAQRENKLS